MHGTDIGVMNRDLPDKISIGHGSGGSMSRKLIKELFAREFNAGQDAVLGDSAVLNLKEDNLAFTTDSYVVDPLFFAGGDIGKMAVCGTVNDLAVAGAIPQYLSAGFIIEEGLSMDVLEKIVVSMAREAERAGVRIVTGDTKVVSRGSCDKLFINTAGIGCVSDKHKLIVEAAKVKVGDKIIINGGIGDHAMAILKARSDIEFESPVISDCCSLNSMIKAVLDSSEGVNFMRDATRGGLATVLVELAEMRGVFIEVDEETIPVNESVAGICDVLGYDPLYLANEGKVVFVADALAADSILKVLQTFEEGKDAAIIGEITPNNRSGVKLNTLIGGSRIIDMLASDQLPRIC